MYEWIEHIQDEHTEGFHRYDEYAARILCELRGIKAPRKTWNYKDFFLKFSFKKKVTPKATAVDMNKIYLHAAMGILDDKREEFIREAANSGTAD